MTLIELFHWSFIVCAALSAGSILFLKNLFHASLALLICLLSLAGIFVLLNAEFIAITQLMIYAGGILVLILFGVMLTGKSKDGRVLMVRNKYTIMAISTGGLFLMNILPLLNVFSGSPKAQTLSGSAENINQIGKSIMTTMLLPFEVAAILLLATLIGASLTASFKKSKV